jgi:hypothetical protein
MPCVPLGASVVRYNLSDVLGMACRTQGGS